MRALIQPGPVHPLRIESHGGEATEKQFSAPAGTTLLQALTTPLVEAGFQAAVLRFSGASVTPFRYVRPAPATDERHVAYFSAPYAPPGQSHIEHGSATFGWRDGKPFLHTHAVWIEPDGTRRGGHILNDETTLTAPISVQAWGFKSLRIDMRDDPETGFTLFHPSTVTTGAANAVLARVRPNEDIITAIETIAHRHAMPNALIAGSVGSLIGTRFTDGRVTEDHATEVLITSGTVTAGRASVDVMSVDMAGRVHQGSLAHGENPVCITFDVVLIGIAHQSINRSDGQT